MSHLTEFIFVLAYVKRRLEGDESESDLSRNHGEFGGGDPIHFPLPKTPPLSQVAEFYTGLNKEVKRSQLRPERKKAYWRFTCAAYHAHRAVLENQPQCGSIWHLQDCLTYITKALRIMERSKDYEDEHPVHWSEVYPTECSPHTMPPGEYWLLFKLESLLPVLQLSVRILRPILPDCPDTWDEWEHSLYHKDWLKEFTLDSRLSSLSTILLHAPRRVDVVGLDTLEAL